MVAPGLKLCYTCMQHSFMKKHFAPKKNKKLGLVPNLKKCKIYIYIFFNYLKVHIFIISSEIFFSSSNYFVGDD